MKMLNRRSLLGTGLVAAALPVALAAGASAQAGGLVGGCTHCQLNRMFFGGKEGTANGGLRIATSSGDAETDRFLGSALSRLSATFQVSPGFAFFDDSKSENAVAVRETLVGNGPGTVLMGMKLFGRLMARTNDGGVTVIAVCAHEFGHIYQYGGYYRLLDQLDSKTNRPHELHADFLAGFYLGRRKSEHRQLDLREVGRELHAMGDRNFTSRQHHGTPEERFGALSAGFKFGSQGNADIVAAAKAGFELIKRNS